MKALKISISNFKSICLFLYAQKLKRHKNRNGIEAMPFHQKIVLP